MAGNTAGRRTVGSNQSSACFSEEGCAHFLAVREEAESVQARTIARKSFETERALSKIVKDRNDKAKTRNSVRTVTQ
jgi:hypothetical protein